MGNICYKNKNCVFCEIVSERGEDDAFDHDKILKYNDKFLILEDLHPAAAHHYLVIPIQHVNNAKVLKGSQDIELVQEMYRFGKDYLQSVEKVQETINDTLYGFHYPPFLSIDHLHLHVISPASTMNITNSNLFRKNTWYFVSPEKLVEQLQKLN